MMLGARPDPEDKRRGEESAVLVGSSPSTPFEWSFREACEISNQPGESCMGFGYAGAIEARAVLEGNPLTISRLAPYHVARQLETPTAKRLIDSGTYTHRLVEGLEAFGVCARDRWPHESLIHEPVPYDVLEAGRLARVNGLFRIWEDPKDRLPAIHRAISQNWPVPYVQEVDNERLAWKGDAVYPGRKGALRGWHCEYICGYRKDAVLVAGSWGTWSGDGGFFWVANEFICSPACTDFTIVTFAPTGVL